MTRRSENTPKTTSWRTILRDRVYHPLQAASLVVLAKNNTGYLARRTEQGVLIVDIALPNTPEINEAAAKLHAHVLEQDPLVTNLLTDEDMSRTMTIRLAGKIAERWVREAAAADRTKRNWVQPTPDSKVLSR